MEQHSNLTKNTVWRFTPSLPQLPSVPGGIQSLSHVMFCSVPPFSLLFLYILRQCLIKLPRLFLNSLCSPGNPWTFDLPAPAVLAYIWHISSNTERAVYLRTYLLTQKLPIFVCHQAILWKYIIVFLNHYNQNKIKLMMHWIETSLFLSSSAPTPKDLTKHPRAVPAQSRGWGFRWQL